jgi:hypothetical protein
MKKLAIGCGVVVVVIGICATIGLYWIAGKAKSYVNQFDAIAKLDQNVVNTAPFSGPANGELTESMMKRFAAVQEAMHARLGPRVEEMTATEDEFMRRQQAEHRKATPSENFKVVTDLMKFILEGKGAQVDALNQQHFSLDEYYWVRERVYAAAGMNIMEISLRNMEQSIKQGAGLTRPVAESTDTVPPRNKKLVAPYLPNLKDWAVFAFFGL